MDRNLTLLGKRFPALTPILPEIECAGEAIIALFANNGTLFVCGNGGSGMDAEHIAGEFLKSFTHKRPLPEADRNLFTALYGAEGTALGEKLEMGLRCVSLLSHPGFGTAFGNDVDAGLVFAQHLWALARPGDMVLGISTSGNAKNIREAFRAAKARGVSRLLLTGAPGGMLRAECDMAIRVPECETYKIQELHLPVYHALCLMVEEHFFPEAR